LEGREEEESVIIYKRRNWATAGKLIRSGEELPGQGYFKRSGFLFPTIPQGRGTYSLKQHSAGSPGSQGEEEEHWGHKPEIEITTMSDAIKYL